MQNLVLVLLAFLALAGCGKLSPLGAPVAVTISTGPTPTPEATPELSAPVEAVLPTPKPDATACKLVWDKTALVVGETASLAISCTHSTNAKITDSTGRTTELKLVDGKAKMAATSDKAAKVTYEALIDDANYPGAKSTILLAPLVFTVPVVAAATSPTPTPTPAPPTLTPNDCSFKLSATSVRLGESTNVQIHCAVAKNVIISNSAGLYTVKYFDANGDVTLPSAPQSTNNQPKLLITYYAVAYAADGTPANLGALNLEVRSTAPAGCVFALQPNVARVGEITNVVAHCDVGQVVQFDGPSGWHQVRYLDANGNASVPWLAQTSQGLAQVGYGFYGTVYGERGEGISLGGLVLTVLNDTPSDCSFRLEPSTGYIGQTTKVIIDCQNAASVTFDGPSGWHQVLVGANHFEVPYGLQSTNGKPQETFSFYATPYGYTGKTLRTFTTNLTVLDPNQYVSPNTAIRRIYADYDGVNHFYPASDSPVANAVVRGFPGPQNNTHALYACVAKYNSGLLFAGVPLLRRDFYLALSYDAANCVPFPEAYLFNDGSQAGTFALYRCFKGVPGFNDHLTTTDPNQCVANGYAVEGVIGYGFAP